MSVYGPPGATTGWFSVRHPKLWQQCNDRGWHAWRVIEQTFGRQWSSSSDLTCVDCGTCADGVPEWELELYLPKPLLLHDEGAGL